MTPQSLSIADLKAVIEYIEYRYNGTPYMVDIKIKCHNELFSRIKQLKPPTETKTEEK